MSGTEFPILVCVSSDATVRQRVVQRLEGVGPVVICADLAQLRAVFPAPPTEPGGSADEPAERPPERAATWGDLVVDRAGHLVTWRGAPLGLTRTERELLARLVSPPITLWSYERLFASVWGGAYLGDTAILHSAVKRLRRKLRTLSDGPQVQTVRGVGYRLSMPPEAGDGRPNGRSHQA
ncbi:MULTISPECIES: winged helix-turn-helix domain-containing protein [unclassified Micromonospora]|uniref:winged helix-turn-helix domain-containing protein n=1 Tax=unclassified Micromonospora TaxID=2617518 RepID=UPI0022B660E8|nr:MULTISPECIES: winged helix-turn-helix domain-containing protein [unclassified Micromonospora]MCZ7419301.1 winged helix-turn-helix domain-containing protein [Verrucosispora sp. WMMA2121]WBB92949.1 winged helix-turn-helix domain-containing protein [Verrucosispora sp. WMMC514]